MLKNNWIAAGLLCISGLSLSGCARIDYKLSEVADHIDVKWGSKLARIDVESIRIGRILYSMTPHRRIVIAKYGESLACVIQDESLGSCGSEIAIINTDLGDYQNLKISDLRIILNNNLWSVVDRSPYQSTVSKNQLRVIDKSIETLIQIESKVKT
jgi:hypothetical protein